MKVKCYRLSDEWGKKQDRGKEMQQPCAIYKDKLSTQRCKKVKGEGVGKYTKQKQPKQSSCSYINTTEYKIGFKGKKDESQKMMKV